MHWLQDVEAFKEAALLESAKPDAEVNQSIASGASHRTLPQLMQAPARPTQPITIWLRTGFRSVFAGR